MNLAANLTRCDQNKGRPNEGAQKQSKHSPNSIFVKFIPSEKNKIGPLAGYFSQFGEVSNVSVNSTKNTAVVRFENPNHAKDAYMCQKPVMGVPTIQMVYNSGAAFVGQPNIETQKDASSHPNVKAAAGSNLTFESEEAKKQRELVQKRRIIKQERKEMINKDNDEILKLIKDLNNDITEEEKQKIKEKIAELKASMNKKLKEQEDDKKKAIESAKIKAATSNKFVAQKAKKKVIQNKWFEMTLKITDDDIKKKCGKVFEKLKNISHKIMDCKLLEEDTAKVKLLHSDMEKLKEEIGKLGVFEITEIAE